MGHAYHICDRHLAKNDLNNIPRPGAHSPGPSGPRPSPGVYFSAPRVARASFLAQALNAEERTPGHFRASSAPALCSSQLPPRGPARARIAVQ